jgi:hypothetical protein
MKLIIHIGTEKTGTTSIQEFLNNNRVELSKQSVYFLKSPGYKNNRKLPRYCMEENRTDSWFRENGINTIEARKKFKQEFRAELQHELENDIPTSTEIVVCSSEHFHSRLISVDEIKTLKTLFSSKFDDIDVLVYLRKQVDMAVSHYSTHLKCGGTEDIHDFISGRCKPSNHYYNYIALLEMWSEVFGQENIKCRLFSRSGFVEGSLIKDFIRQISSVIDFTGLNFEVKDDNKSLNEEGQKVLKYINEIFPRFNENTGLCPINKKLSTRVQEEFEGGHHLKYDIDLNKVQALFVDDNTALKKNWLDVSVWNDSVAQVNSAVSTEKQHATDKYVIFMALLETLSDYILINKKEVSFFKNLAIKIEKIEPKAAYKLMHYAAVMRPLGPVIENKLKEYNANNDG